MASLQKEYNQPKLLGQIYTPIFIVEKILNNIKYNNENILKKKIIDPACGDGRFLCEIAKRIIKYSPESEIKENLSYIYGWDIDETAIKVCIENLNAIIKPLQIEVNWNITCEDALQKIKEKPSNFDFVVGNPPYIRIQHLELNQRTFIQSHFSFCKSGSTDIYIAFFELAIALMNEQGKCGFITPNSFLFTSTAAAFRHFFSEKKLLLQLTNYGEIQLFENATTYSAITIFSKSENVEFLFEKAVSSQDFESITIQNEVLKAAKIWQLSTRNKLAINENHVKLKDVCKIHVGITTLCDKAYIFPIIAYENEEIVVILSKIKGFVRVEKAILKPIIKGSTLKNSTQKINEYVLFPYKKKEGKNQIIQEEILKEKYPLAYEYLCSVKELLDARDNGEPNKVAWYAFGRSQGLDTSFGRKIIFSPMNLKPNFIPFEDETSTFYSGYCIKYVGDFQSLLKAINSQEMEDFIAVSSRDFRGGWKAYSKKTIEDFEVPNELLVKNKTTLSLF